MKRLTMLLVSMMILVFCATSAIADPKMLPADAMVQVNCNGDNTATVNISGVEVESVDFYRYFLPTKPLGAGSSFTINLDEGRRFNFTFDGGYFAGLAPELSKHATFGGAAFLGNNANMIDIDSGGSNGSSFVVTCPAVKVASN